jgi:iron complex outermembrane recepter protein
MNMDIDHKARRATRMPIRFRNARLLGCTALVALTPALSFAQDAGTTEGGTTTLETVVVEKSGGTVLNTQNDSKSIVATQTTGAGKMPTDILVAPAAVSVITSKEIQERGADTVEQVVQYTAGVVTDFYGSDDRFDYFDIRGFTPYTYRDGLTIGRTFAGVREEPYAYERIEVLKGASSSSFGAAEPGGSVNYVTKTPKGERFGEVYGTGGSFAHKELGFDFGDNLTGDDTLSYRLTGKFQRADAEYDYYQDDENFIMGGLAWRPTDATSLTFVFDHLDKDGVPGSGGHPLGTDFDRDAFFGEPDYYFSETNRNSYSVLFDHDFGNGLSFSSNARYSNLNDGFGSAYIGSTPTDGSTFAGRYFFGNEKSTEQFVIDAHLMYEASFNDVESRTLFGATYNEYEAYSDSFYTSAPSINWENPIYSGGPGSIPPYASVNNDQQTTAIYLQQDLTFFDRLTVSAGLRNDWLDLSETDLLSGATKAGEHSEFTKKFGVSYKITEELAPYISYAESVAPPAIWAEPTTGKQYEIGIKYQPDAFPALFTASVYDLTKSNITVFDQVTYIPQTVEKVRHRGFELEAKAELTNNINIIAAYSYIDSKIVEPGGANNGHRLMRVPENMASIWGTYTLEGEGGRGDMTFGLGARYSDAYYTNIENTKSSDSAVVFDAAFTYKVQENTTFQLNVNNVFDEKHVASKDFGAVYYNPGRSILATLRQTW